MKVGDIKVEAIKLMFANYAFDLGVDDLQNMASDENYGSYIVNMNGSISRALDRIENACVMPVVREELANYSMRKNNHHMRVDLTQIKDLFMIDRIIAEYDNGEYDGNVSYALEGDILILPNVKNVNYILLYYPTIKTIDDSVSDHDLMWIPDRLARLIPYFVKSELFQEEEPSLAAEARNLFEASLDDLKRKTQSKQNFITKTYRMY